MYDGAPLRDEAPRHWDHTAHISEFLASQEDANVADVDTERIVLQVDQPQFNHDRGTVIFGPDGYLSIALGDGGGANDTAMGHPPIGRGQDTTPLLGGIMRIDGWNIEEGAVPRQGLGLPPRQRTAARRRRPGPRARRRPLRLGDERDRLGVDLPRRRALQLRLARA